MATYEIGVKTVGFDNTVAPLALTRTTNKSTYAASSISPVHLVVTGQTVTLCTVAGRSTGGTGTVQCGIYITNVAGTTHGALVTSNIPVSTTSTTTGYQNSDPISFDLTPWAGQYIKFATANDSNFRRAYVNGVSGDTVSSSTVFPNPFSGVVNDSGIFAGYMTIEDPTPTNSIDSVNGDDELVAADENTAEVTGYDDGVNPIISGTVGSLALSSVSQTGIDVAFTIDSPINNSYYPEPDASHTLTLTDGTTPATFDAIMRFADYTSVVVASPVNDSEYYLGIWATTPPVNGDRYIYDPLFWTVAADGSYTGATEGPSTIWLHWRASDSKIFAYQSTVSDGLIVSGGLSVTGLSVTGLSVRGLAVTGL